MIMRNVNRDIIKRNVDEWTAQSPHATKEQIFQQVCNELDSGSSFALQYEDFIMVTKPLAYDFNGITRRPNPSNS